MFLYALDVLPLLLVLAAASAHLARARASSGCWRCWLVAGLANNAGQLTRAAEAARALATQRLEAVRPTPGS
jgi:hypothetical protein